MDTEIVKIDRKNFDRRELKRAGELIRAGALVAFPTETVYGLGGNALDERAVAGIYAAKGRPSDNPLIVHIAEIGALKELAVDVPGLAYRLAKRFWPGPMTIILKKSNIVPDATSGGLPTVSVRMPSDPIARALIAESERYIAAPSANLSGRPSPTAAEHVIEDLSGRIEMIVDGGVCDIGLESSMIDLSGDVPMILRPGYITKEDFEEIAARVEYDKAVLAEGVQESAIAKAPGMKYRHYAPKGQIYLVEGTHVAATINQLVAGKEAEGVRAAVLCAEETKHQYCCKHVYSLGALSSEKEISAHLFAALRAFDAEGIDVIYSESFEKTRLSLAIMNRLRKAAGYQMIHC